MKRWIKRSMMMLVAMTLSLVACTSAPTSRDLAVEAVTAMGGNEKLQGIQTMVLQGSGSRTRLGQIMSHGASEDPAQLTNLVETVDLANGRAAHEYDVARPGFMQHRKEVLTKH